MAATMHQLLLIDLAKRERAAAGLAVEAAKFAPTEAPGLCVPTARGHRIRFDGFGVVLLYSATEHELRILAADPLRELERAKAMLATAERELAARNYALAMPAAVDAWAMFRGLLDLDRRLPGALAGCLE